LAGNENPLFANHKKDKKIQVGDTIVVQVTKENVKTKAPFITTNFNFTGKYVVLSHGITKVGISKKMRQEQERNRIKEILNPYKNEAFGLIARTNCEGADASLLIQEIKILTVLYENLLNFGLHKTRFSCIYKAPKTYICSIRDTVTKDLEEILTDDMDIYHEIQEYLSIYQPEDSGKLRFYTEENGRLVSIYGIETKLQKALQKQVWLKSGGSLVIEPTEALTVIDVNTGKAIKGKKQIQETFRKLNIEAAAEIAKQIRLRNLSGIILVDFIDLDAKEAKDELLEQFGAQLKKDRIETNLVDMTALGLVELTRKKVRKPLHEQVKNSII
ncbi:MAG: ribonuclease, partial [Clostridiales bacterium]|nr:ribonuclease [Clostridiales bacterium]